MRHRTQWTKHPWLFIELDEIREIALVRGRDAIEAIRLLDDEYPTWSVSGRGWVISLSTAHDLIALGQYRHEFVLTKRVIGPLPGEFDGSPLIDD